MMKRIVTHPGSAHKDEFLACCLLISRYGLPVLRREPDEEDLRDPQVIVVDVGGEHDPQLLNFDHHQFPRDHAPICALSLVLQHLELYEEARSYCEWLEPAEWFDTRGPFETAQWLGVDKNVMARLTSPIDITLLRRFAQKRELQPGDPVWEVMRMVGEDLIMFLKNLSERMAFLEEHAEVLHVDNLAILFLPRTEPMPDDPSSGLVRYIESKNLPIQALIYPDRRGGGYALGRHEDYAGLDYHQLSDQPDVHFAHARGFVAKTSATDLERLKELVLMARK